MTAAALAVLLAAWPASGGEFAGKLPRPPASAGADAALCAGLARSTDQLKLAFVKGADFPDQVANAFAGEGSAEATTDDYLKRGQELYQLAATVAAQCRTAFGGSGSFSVPEQSAIRRRAESAKRSVDVYLDLPKTVAMIDGRQEAADLSARGEFLTAMYKIADGGDYGAAAAIADRAHAALSRLRR